MRTEPKRETAELPSPPPQIDCGAESVAVLLCTFNGEEFLSEQLDSIGRQTHRNWIIYASDDGSSDATLDILRKYQEQFGTSRLIIQQGPRKGFSWNFLSLLRNREINANFYAFCDQDDIWHPDKLERGINNIRQNENFNPALYCSRTHLIDSHGKAIGYSPLFSREPSFANALVQSLAGANTMLLNEAARALFALIPQDARIVSHDWLSYLIVTGAGGRVIYDPKPTLDYRQHGSNLIGANGGIIARWQRIRMLFSGRFSEWNEQNIHALILVKTKFTAGNLHKLQCFESSRKSGVLGRINFLWTAKVYRQTFIGNIGLTVAACIGRI